MTDYDTFSSRDNEKPARKETVHAFQAKGRAITNEEVYPQTQINPKNILKLTFITSSTLNTSSNPTPTASQHPGPPPPLSLTPTHPPPPTLPPLPLQQTATHLPTSLAFLTHSSTTKPSAPCMALYRSSTRSTGPSLLRMTN